MFPKLFRPFDVVTDMSVKNAFYSTVKETAYENATIDNWFKMLLREINLDKNVFNGNFVQVLRETAFNSAPLY